VVTAPVCLTVELADPRRIEGVDRLTGVEHLFEYEQMTTTSLRRPSQARRAPDPVKLAKARAAADRARRLQGEQLGAGILPVSVGLVDLLPDRGLRAGASYDVRGSTALVAALLAEATASGHWCGVVAMPEFAAVSAQELGCDLDRLVLVPTPGPEWVNVTAALVDALSVVVVRPASRVSDAEATRLGARLRRREAVLISCGGWPRSDVTLTATPGGWSGLGHGYGRLRHRRTTVEVRERGAHLPRRFDVWLPGEDGSARVAAPADPAGRETGVGIGAELPAAVGWP